MCVSRFFVIERNGRQSVIEYKAFWCWNFDYKERSKYEFLKLHDFSHFLSLQSKSNVRANSY